ncbi:hypothetical protein K443DRAFT_7274 [Laccaria amethystina LaAM-08-1]|uniref:Uncharacterized protein n=1 Tax=Laccaria amethystina LaAM-08-1 TaxID=1095629 RepID=A0A0C9WR64_9AGAR|nr:hypothetical protein K443DRAFT_7274 [Laccaria amethystina LaAM-08-1]
MSHRLPRPLTASPPRSTDHPHRHVRLPEDRPSWVTETPDERRTEEGGGNQARGQRAPAQKKTAYDRLPTTTMAHDDNDVVTPHHRLVNEHPPRRQPVVAPTQLNAMLG